MAQPAHAPGPAESLAPEPPAWPHVASGKGHFPGQAPFTDVKEFSRKKRDDEGLWAGFRVKLGDGDCDWPAVRQALHDIGYSGWGAAEVPGGGRERLREISQRMDKILAAS